MLRDAVTDTGATSSDAVVASVRVPLRRAAEAAYDGARSRSIRRKLVRRALAAADAVGLTLAYAAAATADRGVAGGWSATVFVLTLPVWLAAAHAYGLYDDDHRRPEHSTLDELGRLVHLVTLGTWCALVAIWALSHHVPAAGAIVFWTTALVAVVAARATIRAGVRRHRSYAQRTLIVGAGEVGQLVARKLVQHPEWGLRVVGFLDAQPRPIRAELENVPVLGTPSDLVEALRQAQVDRVIVAFSGESHQRLVELVRSARKEGVDVDVVPRLFETLGPLGDLHLLEGLPLVNLLASKSTRLDRALKRTLDLAVGGMLLVLALPLFAWIAWRIKRDSRGPVLFRQVRLGEGGRPFTLLKFRTMATDAEEAPHRDYVRQIMNAGASPNGNGLYKLDRSDDVTPFGAWLRRTSLDELPQLVNVVRGEMSLVGPRPCISYETELFEPHHFDRFLVPAGMTGLWQVAARARATFKEALDLDAAYAQSWSLRLDLWLLVRTPLALLRGRTTT